MSNTNGTNGANSASQLDQELEAIQELLDAERANGKNPIAKKRKTAPYTRSTIRPVRSLEDARTPGERIRKLLAMSGTTMLEFAELSGIPHSSVSSICTGRMDPTGDRLHVIADLLGVSEAFIMYGTGAPAQPPTVDVTPTRAITVRAHAEPLPSGNYRIEETARLMGQLPPKIQRSILAFVRTLADSALDGDLA